MFRGGSPTTVTSGCRSADRTPMGSSRAVPDQADGTRHRPAPPAAADGGPPGNSGPLEGPSAAGALQPRADQHQIGSAGRQQCDRERDMHSLAGCFEGRSHGMKTSGDSTRGVSHDIFCGIQDSFTTQAPSRHIWTRDSADPSIAREPPVAGLKPSPAGRVEVFSREAIRCPMHCSAMTPS